MPNSVLMGKQIGVNLEEKQVDAFEEMQEQGDADSYSEAVRTCATIGLQEMGYINGQKADTTLKQSVYSFAWLFMVAGATGLAFTAVYPVPTRLPSLAVGAFGGLLFGVYTILDSHEPAVTNKIKAIFGGETA
jgi:hypothetical protein